MYVVAQEDVDLGRGIKVARGERVLMEVSRKFTLAGVDELAYRSGLFLQVPAPSMINHMYSTFLEER